MYDNQKNDLKNEIDFKELLITLWNGKIFIILFAFISVVCASIFIRNVEVKYTVEYKLKPVSEAIQANSFSGLSGIASLAGVQLPSSSTNDFMIFKELLTSIEVSEKISDNKDLIKNIYSDEWSDVLNNYVSIPKTKIQILIENLKKLLIGEIQNIYIPPDARRLSLFFSKNVQISEDKETGFINIISETSKPEIMISLIVEAAEASDEIMRQRYIDFSAEPLNFYKEKLQTARSREHRVALAELIASEEQKLMFASRGKYFIAMPFINPTVRLYPTYPKSTLILVLSLIFGLFFGSTIFLVKNAIVKDNL